MVKFTMCYRLIIFTPLGAFLVKPVVDMPRSAPLLPWQLPRMKTHRKAQVVTPDIQHARKHAKVGLLSVDVQRCTSVLDPIHNYYLTSLTNPALWYTTPTETSTWPFQVVTGEKPGGEAGFETHRHWSGDGSIWTSSCTSS
jgi:hypothetical protein